MTLEQVPLFPQISSTAPAKYRGTDALFDIFWQAYPRKVGKEAARRKFARAVEQGVTLDAMLATIEQWRGEWASRPQFTPHPATWLNQGRWDDDPPVPRGVVELAPPRLGTGMSALARYRERRR
jgi:hypothetical protein